MSELELQELIKDAERYRWLRAQNNHGQLTVVKVGTFDFSAWSGDDLDGSIDRELLSKKDF
jgi:hypothetical protein